MTTAPPPQPSGAAQSRASARRHRVVVVEPDASARSLLEVAVRGAGFEVDAAGSAREGRSAIGPGRPLPVLVVLSAETSDKDGFAFCSELKADLRTKSVPVVLIGRSDDPLHKERAVGVGADDYLPKPLFAGDVAALTRVACAPVADDGALCLEAARLPPPQLLRALLAGSRSGRVWLLGGRAQLHFRRGRVIDATFDSERGVDALLRALVLAEGDYALSFGDDGAPAAMLYGLRELVGNAFPYVSRWRSMVAKAVPLEAYLAVDFAQLARVLDELPDAVNQVVRLFDGHRDVRQVLIDSPLNEVVALEVVTRLYAMGVILPAPPPVGGPLRKAPPLFHRSIKPAPAAALPSDLETQLEAFKIATEVEPRQESATEAGLSRFAHGVVEAPSTSISQVSEQALEDVFFGAASVEAPVARLGRSEAPVARLGRSEAPVARLGRSAARMVLSLSAMALLITSAGLVAWKLSVQQRPPLELSARSAVPPPPVETAPVPSTPASLPVAAPEPAPAEVTPAPALLGEGLALYEAGNAERAVEVLERALKATPDAAEGWLVLGLARFDLLDDKGAEEAGRRALELDPKSGRALMLLASVHLGKGEKSLAAEELRRYLALEPRGPFAADARKLLAGQ